MTLREYAYAYLRLPWSTRWTIMERLGVKLHEMPNPNRDVCALVKVRQAGKLDEWKRLVEERCAT